MSVRKAHNNGRNHLRNVQAYYEQISSDQTQQVINSITDAYNTEGQANPLFQQNLSGGFVGGPMGPMPGMGPPMGMPGFPPPGEFGHIYMTVLKEVADESRYATDAWNATTIHGSRRT